jgi:hypothetical protein
LISQPTKAAERSTMVTIGTVLAELVAAAGSRLRQRRGRAEAHALVHNST